ncbi:hypothetical protein J1N35_002969 [Gossypium stocksii]|uniref:TF-B3 domain-containing protein n=1 Tax=Gossypium stocksii TaxID=47602 RepID=A0A9D3WMT5_9ROSI|nr:hypothetical protein J1N35_002969 [Gossypium stocksii]
MPEINASFISFPKELEHLNSLSTQLCPMLYFLPLFLTSSNPSYQASTFAVLRSYGRTWSVKIRDRRFEDGWQDFARDHDLHVGDFLVFRYGGNMVFDVVVFDTSACQRQYPLLATQTQQPAKEIGKQHEKRTSTSVTLESPHFVSNLTLESMKSFRLNIPRKFARSNDLDRSCETVLVDEQGRSWMASIRLKDSDGQVYIGRGWRNICIGNSLGLKDCVKLELIGNGITPIFKLYTNYCKGNYLAIDNSHFKAGFELEMSHLSQTIPFSRWTRFGTGHIYVL